MVFIPSQTLFQRVEFHLKLGSQSKSVELFDMDIINRELACTGEILVLPKHYGTLSTEYLRTYPLYRQMEACRNFDHVQYFHFSSRKKPWQEEPYSPSFKFYDPPRLRDFMAAWFDTFQKLYANPTDFNVSEKVFLHLT